MRVASVAVILSAGAASANVTASATANTPAPANAHAKTAASPFPPQSQENDAPSPASTHYARTLGPYSFDGAHFTVKLNVICYKSTTHDGPCGEDDEETVKSMEIDDEPGKASFRASFPVAFAHQLERHLVEVTRLEGAEHQALEIQYERLPSRANTGVSIQLFGVRNGKLQPFSNAVPESSQNAVSSDAPFEFYGGLGALPAGSSSDSRRLLPGDALPVYVITNYFYILQPVRLNWTDFRLEPQQKGTFEIAQAPPFSRKPEIQAEGFIHLYPEPDEKASPAGVTVSPQSSVQLLRAIFRASPSEAHSSASTTWLNISVDGKVGWIVGLDDYTAIGLTSVH